ncbi:MAG TPA: AAA family ATPase [Methanosarcina sp.]|nr:AAA family ATPase [Methanosarcina sp.]
MSFRIRTLTVKNFMSVGNATQAVDFDRQDLTLVLGENLDLGGDDSGARNGTGKTTIINALSYALYGNALTNIKKDNLINKSNQKNMLVTIDFEKDGQDYRIERGRKPGVMKFFVGDNEKEITDDAQGDSRETQADIERMLGMSHDMFKHIVALNTYTEPFLSLKSNDQRTIIEQLLGITLLSEKAEKLKELTKETKDAITQEEFRIKAVTDANKRIEEQIASLVRRQTLWRSKHSDDILALEVGINELLEIDIDAEIQEHHKLALYNQKKKDIADISALIDRATKDQTRESKLAEKLAEEIAILENHTCHTCGQEFHDETQKKVLEQKTQELKAAETSLEEHAKEILSLTEALQALGELGAKPTTFYDKESDAVHHRSSVESLQRQLEAKRLETDPYAEQIIEMKEKGLETISYDIINELSNFKDHQDFLLKLLTNKESFIRKRIIDQNLSYLNARLGQYLDRIGLPHTVKFNNDLTVSITELGRDLDFDNLSRGERNRLILSLSWAFRDVWESLYHPINLLFIDELIDSGMDSSGVENSLAILKKMSRESNKSVWLVSHKDELVGRVNNTLKVVKENGFTVYDTDIEIT